LTSPPMTSGYTYSWLKVSGSGTSVLVPPTTLTNISSYPGTIAAPDYTGITGLAADAGTYVLRVEDGNAGNSLCYAEASVVVIVNPKPVITGVLDVCNGSTTQLSGSGTAATNTAWTSATPAVATVSSTGLVTAVSTGTSRITFTSDKGCSQTAVVTVNALPTITGTLYVCVGSTTTLTGSGTPDATTPWASATPAVAIVSSTGVVSGFAAGTSVITYKNSNGCIRRATVTVNAHPTITGTLTVCVGSTTTLTGSGTPDATTPWSSATTSVATVTSAGVVTGVSAGTSVITYKTSAGCIQTATVTVNQSPPVNVAIATPATTVCAGTNVTFTSIPTNGGTTPTYQWQKDGTNIAFATNATYSTTAAANGDSYSLIMTSNATCTTGNPATSNTIVLTVTTVVAPAVTITAAPANTICAGTNVTFTATPDNGGIAPTFEWFIGTASQGAASTTATTFTSSTLTNGDQVFVKMISNTACAITPFTNSNVINMTVHAIPSPSVSAIADKTSACPGDNITFTASPTNGGTPTEYQWKNNGTIIPGATNATHTIMGTVLGSPNSVTVEMVSHATCAPSIPVASAPVVVTITSMPVAAVSISADKSVICAGNPVTFTATAINAGNPSYEWFSGSAGSEISSGAPSTEKNTFTTSSLTATNNSVFVRIISSLSCASTAPITSNTIKTTVNAGISSGIIGSDQTICYNSIPLNIIQTSSSNAVAPAYYWESSANGVVWVNAINSSTNPSYTFTSPLTSDVYIRRVVTDITAPAPCNVAASNAVHITVLPSPSYDPGTIAGDETLCAGGYPSMITSVTTESGGSFTNTTGYSWLVSDDGVSNWTVIAGATNAQYQPGMLTKTTYYKREAYNYNLCDPSNRSSNIVVKTITQPEVVSVSLNDPGQVCAGSAAFTFTATVQATGSGTIIYQWYVGSMFTGNTSSTYSYTPVSEDNGKTIKVVATTSNTCNSGPATSNIVTLDIVHATTPTVTITASNNPSCAGLPVTFTATATGTGNSPTYLWYVNGAAAGSGTTGPVTKNVFTTTSLVNGDKVEVQLTSNLGCLIGTNPFTSNVITMVIKPIPTPVINEGDQIICADKSFKYTSTVSMGTTYQWIRNGVLIPGATNSTYTTSLGGIYTIQEDNGTCNQTSSPVTLTIDPCGAFSTFISGPNPIISGQQNTIYSVFNQNGFSYEWIVVGGTIVSGQNTNEVTVDWEPFTTDATTPYSISVRETNPSQQNKTTILNVSELTTGVAKSFTQSGITLFPNPTAESFNIEMPETGIAVHYEIIDLTGVSVAQGNFISTGNAEKITTGFGAGMYQVILRYNNTVTCGRLSKVQ
ncbi:MAG: Ig-like domain-containing protein, partial [Cytophaga sp.]|uniref:Ig-like domain-containing protein n=1 Tax=Cytophaga sp. TaxID=29535 RepID=UPI003F7D8ACF